ncbi:helix-turn-helix domain-containing protein [Bacteroidota bacterium]
MEDIKQIQHSLFQQIKETLPPNHSFIHEIAELLGISYDSAYRRVRGDKELTMEDLYRLATQFNLSIDSLFNVKNNNVTFNCAPLDSENFKVKDWLKLVLQTIKDISSASEKEIIYAAKDVPVFHYFQIPEIAAFKVFFWEKTLFQFPEYKEKMFRLDETDPEIIKIGQQSLVYANKVPTKEIWNLDTFNIMLRQIEFYWVSGFFEKKDDLIILIDRVEKWIQHIQKQAEAGFKFIFGQAFEGIENSYQFYENEVVLSDNTILVNTDGKYTVFLTFNVLSLLVTKDEFFSGYVSNYMRGLLKTSNMISLYGAKDRNRFFNTLFQSIDKLKSKVFD